MGGRAGRDGAGRAERDEGTPDHAAARADWLSDAGDAGMDGLRKRLAGADRRARPAVDGHQRADAGRAVVARAVGDVGYGVGIVSVGVTSSFSIVMVTVSTAVRPSSSVTVSVISCMPTSSDTSEITPVAISIPANVQR